jgi:hypothetical protein
LISKFKTNMSARPERNFRCMDANLLLGVVF